MIINSGMIVILYEKYKGAWQMYEGHGLGTDQPVVPYIHPDLQGQS